MFYKAIASVVLLLLSLLPLSAQNHMLTKEGNMLPDSDDVALRQLPCFLAGQAGENVVWDMSDIDFDGEEQAVRILNDAKGRNMLMTNTNVYCYVLNNDTLNLTKRENRLCRYTYEHPQFQIKYPFAYGDSVTVPFKAYGVYCGDHPFKEQGVATVMADATGNIVIGDDTIKNVLRLYSLKSYSICMDTDSTALDSARTRQVIEERYDWFARGYRYPVFTTISSTSYDNLTMLGTTRKAYCLLPYMQKLRRDPYNEDIRRKDSLASVNGNGTEPDIFHYSVSLNGNQITVSYSLDEACDITALVCDPIGIVYRQKRTRNCKGDAYCLTIDCSGLHCGQYILYLKANGKVYNNKVALGL